MTDCYTLMESADHVVMTYFQTLMESAAHVVMTYFQILMVSVSLLIMTYLYTLMESADLGGISRTCSHDIFTTLMESAALIVMTDF